MEFYLLGKFFGSDFFFGGFIFLGAYLFIKIVFRNYFLKTARAGRISSAKKYKRLEQLYYGVLADNERLTNYNIKLEKEIAYQVKNNQELGDTIYDLSQKRAELTDEFLDLKGKYEQVYIERDSLRAQIHRDGYVVDEAGKIKKRVG